MLGFSSISETAIGQLPEPFRHSNIFVTGFSATLFLEDVLVWGIVVPGVTTTYANVAPGVTTTYTNVAAETSQTYTNVITGASQTYTNVAVEASQTWTEEKR